MRQLKKVLERSAFKVQQAYKVYRLKQNAKKHRVFQATITLQTKSLDLGQIDRVEIFGEFTDREPEGAWGKKIKCQNIDSTTYKADVNIRIG